MDVKKCPQCNQEKSVSEFGKNSRQRDGLQSGCKECRNVYGRSWYYKNPDKHVRRVSESKRKVKQFLYDYLIDHPCVDCGESRPECLEFDHVSGVKTDNVSTLAQRGSMNKLIEEIKKCEVVCANCHKVRTAQQFGWYSALVVK